MHPLLGKTIIFLAVILAVGLVISSAVSPHEGAPAAAVAEPLAAMGSAIDEPAAPPPVRKFAVIIGIVYDNYEFGWIKYADQDAASVYSLLTRSLGFPAENVILLQNSLATRDNILKALDWLATNPGVDSSSEVVVYFSGHGVRNGPGVGMNIPEVPASYALVPFDFMNYDFKKGAGLLWDTDLADRLSKINPGSMWISVDTCSSGGFIRPGIAGPNRVVTASSQGDELSSEIDLTQRGVFTQLLVEEGIAKGLSVEEAFAAAAPRAAQEYGQTPQIADGYPGNMRFR